MGREIREGVAGEDEEIEEAGEEGEEDDEGEECAPCASRAAGLRAAQLMCRVSAVQVRVSC